MGLVDVAHLFNICLNEQINNNRAPLVDIYQARQEIGHSSVYKNFPIKITYRYSSYSNIQRDGKIFLSLKCLEYLDYIKNQKNNF